LPRPPSTVGDRLAARPLTDHVALADGTLVVVLLTSLFAWQAGRWGGVDAAVRRVDFDDPDNQIVGPKAPLGRQGFVYLAVAGLVLVRLLTIVLPPSPTLVEVVLARAVLAGLVVFAATGVGYVRGAANTRAGVTALTVTSS
jgi:hypothetical protein